ncbi:hypothetical protein GNF10_00025 [Nostoc sp. UCD121]|uniref:hypothetical protein n=1 Tax=unclassified Nostoc TaxID=2593658 RepID=UPI00162A9ABC|nr:MULTISPECIES: hypothetical protein [unclassified Nostoc]MBC1222778.1 hypothetical protein [Nostoc sp. UCD120]MBC1274406.1 hypothetical protein [Nostoc sp. UCD121]MBC1299278.1 hypothetical protein [Nostoc sp. UCD122]
MKSLVYRNVGVTACCLGLLVALVGCFGVSVSFESANPDTSSQLPSETQEWEITSSKPLSSEKGISVNLSTPTNKVEHSSKENTYPVLAERDKSASKAKNQGTLRMSNQTNQPVRLALLARESVAKGSGTKQANYDVPAHWDFAPQEGSEKGLVLSLPQNNLKLEKGDILVAFAQDGSRRYWGPYVVGETQLPKWNSQSREWQLVLSP